MLQAAIIFCVFGILSIVCGIYRAYGFDPDSGKLFLLISELVAFICFMVHFAEHGLHYNHHSGRRE